MSFPKTSELSEQIINSIQASLNQNIPLLPKAFNRVIAKILAGVLIVLYKYSSFILLQVIPSTASFKETEINGKIIRPLVEWGRLLRVGDPDPAVPAELLIKITVLQQGGTLTSLEAGVISSDNNITYLLKNDTSLNAETVSAIFVAAAGINPSGAAGVQGNLAPGSLVSFTTPYADIKNDAVVEEISVFGVDEESEESYRQKVENHFAARAQGGAPVDYVYWAKKTPGARVINVYPFTGYPGEVDVYSEVQSTELNPDGIPTPAELILIKEAIENNQSGLAENRPLGSFVNSLAIVRTGFSVDVFDMSCENYEQVKLLIEDALTIYFKERENYIVGVTRKENRQQIKRDDVQSIVNDYVSAANGFFSLVKVKFAVSSIFFLIYSLEKGEKAKLTQVNYLQT